MFRKKVQKDIYRFTKSRNKQGVEVNTLYNYKNEPVYRAYVTEEGQSESIYCFHNLHEKSRTAHTVGRITDSERHAKTFDFDGVDIWKRLSRRGITLRTTSVNEKRTVFRIFKHGVQSISVRMQTNKDDSKTMTIQSDEADEKLLFLITFILSQIF